MKIDDTGSMMKKDIAEIFKVSPTTVYKWTKAGCPKDGSKFDLKDVLDWYLDFKADSDLDEKAVAELERIKLQNTKLDLDIAKIKKSTIPISEHEQICYKVGIAVKMYFSDQWRVNHLQDMNELSCKCSVVKYIEYTQKKINEMLNTFSQIVSLK